MSDPLDDLLAKLNSAAAAESPALDQPTDKSTGKPTGKPTVSSDPKPVKPIAAEPVATRSDAPAPSIDRSASIDDLLQNLNSPTSSPSHLPQSAPSPLPANSQAARSPSANLPNASLPKNSQPDPLLSTLKQQYEQQDETDRLQQQRQQEADRQQQQRLAQQRRLQQEQRAANWLKQLDHRSDEAAWFEAFAANYATPLEAAIDYLGE